jgi:hypothetical protein
MIDLFDWRNLRVGEGANAWEGGGADRASTGQAYPGTCLEVRAIAL